MKRPRAAVGNFSWNGLTLGLCVSALLLTAVASFAGPGDTIAQFPNTWATATMGLAYDPVHQIVLYVHESQSSTHDPTVFDYDYGTGTIVSSTALSVQNPGWPWQLDNRDGATYDPDTGTYFLPDYNGDLSYADDNIVEVDASGNIIAVWETDDEVGSNDCANGGEIDEIIDITYDPDNPRRYYVTAAYDGNNIYYIDLSNNSGWWVPNSWLLLDTIVPTDLDGIISDILGIEWDPVQQGYWVSDWNSDNIALLDRNFNLVQVLTVTTPAGYSSGITPMNDVGAGHPYQIWLTDFTSDTTTVVESLSSSPGTSICDLSVAKVSSAVGTVYAGDQVSYTMTVTNNGPDDATGVSVTDSLPVQVSYVSDTCSGAYDDGSHAWTWAIGALLNGASAACNVVVEVQPGSNGDVVNTATVAGAEDDPTPGNDSASATVTTALSADLAVTKTSDVDGTVYAGDHVTYTMTVTNNGPDDATGVSVSDSLPAQVSYVSDTCSGAYDGGSHTWTWAIGALLNGASTTCNVVVEVVPGANGPIANSASVVGAELDLTAGNDTSTASAVASNQIPGIPALDQTCAGLLALLLAAGGLMVLRRRTI